MGKPSIDRKKAAARWRIEVLPLDLLIRNFYMSRSAIEVAHNSLAPSGCPGSSVGRARD